MLRPSSLAATLVLAGLVALGPVATDIYLPALPAIGKALQADTGAVQLTLSVYLVGIAFAQLIYGPLADRYGRKPVILIALALFVLTSVGCASADSIESLTVFRFLQSLGGAAGPVLGRAAVRDIHGPRDAARIMSYLGTAIALAPAIAPTIGGILSDALGWQAVFYGLAIYAAVAGALFAWGLPETLDPSHRQSVRPRALLRNYGELLRHRGYLGYTFTNAAVFAGLFAFVSGAPFVLIEYLGVPTERFGLYFTTMVAGFIAGTLFAGRCSDRLGIDRLVLIGSAIAAVSGGTMALLAGAGVHTVAAVIAPQAVYALALGLVLPQTMAGALAPFPHMAGSASALFGFVQMGVAAAAGAVVGHLHDGTPLVMAAGVAAGGAATLVIFLVLARPRREALADSSAP